MADSTLIRLSPRLTINAGLRWDYFGHWATGKNGKIPFTMFTPGSGATFSEQIANGAMQAVGFAVEGLEILRLLAFVLDQTAGEHVEIQTQRGQRRA